VEAAAADLGFKRLGKVIVERLEAAFDEAQSINDRQGDE
jgi:hypothetical protein